MSMPLPRIVAARHVAGHIVWLRFSDGLQGEIDLKRELSGPVFEPLLDPEYFRQVVLNPTIHTLVWPNGADFAPEFLRARLAATKPSQATR